jgi:tetratricopeptide (TPR) repeat protein
MTITPVAAVGVFVPPPARAQSAELFIENAEEYAAREAYDIATELYAKAIEIEDSAIHFYPAEALSKLRNRGKVLTHYWRAYGLDPDSEEGTDTYAKATQIENYFSDVSRLQTVCASGTNYEESFPGPVESHEAAYYRYGNYGEDFHRFKVKGERLTWWSPIHVNGFKVYTRNKWAEHYILARADPVVVCAAGADGLIYYFNESILLIADHESRDYATYPPVDSL